MDSGIALPAMLGCRSDPKALSTSASSTAARTRPTDPSSATTPSPSSRPATHTCGTRLRYGAHRWLTINLKLFGNFGVPFNNDGLEFYGHTNYATKKVTGGFYYRNPATRGGVFGSVRNGDGHLLIGDVLAARGAGSANCPQVAVTGGVVSDQAALDQVFADPNCFSMQELREEFRGGFTPQFGGTSTDASLVSGLRGLITDRLVWDTSISGRFE